MNKNINQLQTDDNIINGCKIAVKSEMHSLKIHLISELNKIDSTNTTAEIAGIGAFVTDAIDDLLDCFLDPVQKRLLTAEQRTADRYEQSKIDQAVADWKFNT